MRRRALLRAAGAGAGALALSTFGSAADGDDPYAPLGTAEVSNSAEAVVSDGGDVAYVAKANGFATVDLSDPADPEVLAEVTGVEPASDAGRILDVKVDGDRLILPGPANPGSPSGFELYDVSDPSNPSQVGEFFETGHAIHNAFLHDGYAYLTDNETDGRPLHVVDVSNDSPESVARWSPLDYDPPDVDGWRDVPFLPGTIHDVYVQDGVAYCAYWDAGTWMVDVSDPANPEYLARVGDYSLERLIELTRNTSELSEMFLEAPGNDHYVTVNDDASLMAVGGEAWDDPRTEGGGPAGIDLWDVSDLANPRKLSTIHPETADDTTRQSGTWTTAHNFELRGDRLYSSWYQAGVKIHDVSDPSNPEQLAWWLRPEEAYFWTAQVATPGETFVASTYGGKSTAPGLYVFPDEAGEQQNRPSLGGEPRTTPSTTTTSTSDPGGRTHTVELTDQLAFDPEEIAIAVGDTVEWANVGSLGHSVTAYEDDIPGEATYFASGGFDSESAARDAWPEGEIAGGETYSHTFETTGTYEYFCIPHEGAGMTGTVTVEADGGGGNDTTTATTATTDTPSGTTDGDDGGSGDDDDGNGDGGNSGSMPGFGVLAAVGGLGLGAYRYLRRDDGE